MNTISWNLLLVYHSVYTIDKNQLDSKLIEFSKKRVTVRHILFNTALWFSRFQQLITFIVSSTSPLNLCSCIYMHNCTYKSHILGNNSIFPANYLIYSNRAFYFFFCFVRCISMTPRIVLFIVLTQSTQSFCNISYQGGARDSNSSTAGGLEVSFIPKFNPFFTTKWQTSQGIGFCIGARSKNIHFLGSRALPTPPSSEKVWICSCWSWSECWLVRNKRGCIFCSDNFVKY